MLILSEKGDKKINLKEYVLILPAVSVGNVGQLAADLLISTLKLTSIGYIRHKNILPVAAHVAGTTGITTECQVYGSSELKVAVVQIRSTFGPFASISSFFSELCKSVKSVVILTGSFAYKRKNIQLVAEPLRFFTTDSLKKCQLPPIPQDWQKLDVSEDTDRLIRIPGSGIADHLFQQCLEEEIAAAVIVNYVSEGDNRGDAVSLANYLDSWLQIRKRAGQSEKSWQFPSVWDCLYGNSIPAELF